MNCNEFNEQLTEYISISQLSTEMIEHKQICINCKKESEQYFDVISSLKPKTKIIANQEFKESIINNLNKTKKMKSPFIKTKTIVRIVSIAAIFIIALIIIPLVNNNQENLLVNSAKAAEKMFEKSIYALRNINNIVIALNIRTLEGDNFELIGSDYDFVEHTIKREFIGGNKWKIEKPSRVVSFDGQNQYLFIKNAGYAIKGDKNAGFVEWLKKLLNPAELFNLEIKNSQQCENCSYTVDKSGSDILLTINSKAKGNFDNPYLKNSSITESDSKILYTFSKEDNLLKGLQVFIINNEKEVLILNIEDIKYNVQLSDNDFNINLPDGIEWQTPEKVINNKLFANISSDEAAKLFFEACSKNEWDKITDVFPILESKSDEVRNYLGGLTIISIDKSFKSGLYPGEFVPYKIKFKDGSIKEMNLALRNDNLNKIWMIDGGL